MRFGSIFLQLLDLALAWAAAVLQNEPVLAGVDQNRRVDCGPEPTINQQICEQRGCLWSPTQTPVRSLFFKTLF